jgi:hypothetical protein
VWLPTASMGTVSNKVLFPCTKRWIRRCWPLCTLVSIKLFIL